MLKRKRDAATLILSCLITTAIASGNRTNLKKPVHYLPGIYGPVIHQFDSTGLCTCIPMAGKTEIVDALRINLNKNVAGFVKDYNKKNGFFMGKTRRRIAPYFTIIDSIFEEQGIPVELKYLAYIESGLKCHTVSRSGAIGPWAFMPVAAREYGLRMSKYKDERLDYYKSSAAAAALLTNLYSKYEDWLLVLAAYNAGPGWIDKAIKRSGSRNFWVLQNFLPKETRAHVKKFIAVHYYFEGHGSLATMTKNETESHVRAVEVYFMNQKELEKIDTSAVVVK